MMDRDLRRMNRRELLELLVDQGRRLEEAEQEVQLLKRELETRQLKIQATGSMAEAALAMNGVFEAADAAAKQYLDNIYEESHKAALVLAEEESKELVADARKEAEAIRQKAIDDANSYARAFNEDIAKFLQKHPELEAEFRR